MSAIRARQSLTSTYHKMDTVLYEIHDNKGIPTNLVYDAWKVEVLDELESSGFIEKKGLLYVITEEGREVLRHESFVFYHQHIKPIGKKASAYLQEEKPPSSKFGIILLFAGLTALVLIWLGLKMGVLN